MSKTHPAFTFYKKHMALIYGASYYNKPPAGSVVARALANKMHFAKHTFNRPGVQLWFPDDELGLTTSKLLGQGNVQINECVRQLSNSFWEYTAEKIAPKPINHATLYSHTASVPYNPTLKSSTTLADQCTYDKVEFTGHGYKEINGQAFFVVSENSTWDPWCTILQANAGWHWIIPTPVAAEIGYNYNKDPK